MSRALGGEKEYYRIQKKRPMPVRWMAPEIFKTGKWTVATDVWAYGMLLYEIFSYGKLPFADTESTQVLAILMAVESGSVVAPPPASPMAVGVLLQDCVSMPPAARPTFEIVADRTDPTQWPALLDGGLFDPARAPRRLTLSSGRAASDDSRGRKPGKARKHTHVDSRVLLEAVPGMTTELQPTAGSAQKAAAAEPSRRVADVRAGAGISEELGVSTPAGEYVNLPSKEAQFGRAGSGRSGASVGAKEAWMAHYDSDDDDDDADDYHI